MVPFFGQGLNCGLEDVRVLDVVLRMANVSPIVKQGASLSSIDVQLEEALQKYTESRHKDLIAISDPVTFVTASPTPLRSGILSTL